MEVVAQAKFIGTYRVTVGRDVIGGQVYATPKGKGNMAKFMHKVLVFAGFVIHSGLGKPEVLENIEAYTTLIAILGGPALLIIKDALDVWKQEQAEKTAFYKVKAQSVIDYNEATQKQAQMIESKAQEQEHKMETKK